MKILKMVVASLLVFSTFSLSFTSKELEEKALYYEETGQFNSAIDVFLEYQKICPEDWTVYNHLGSCYYAMGQVSEAYKCFELSYSSSPNSWYALYCLGCINSIDFKDYKKAKEYFEIALKSEGLKDNSYIFLVKYNLLVAEDALALDYYNSKEKTKLISSCVFIRDLSLELERMLEENPKLVDGASITNQGFLPVCSKYILADIKNRERGARIYLEKEG